MLPSLPKATQNDADGHDTATGSLAPEPSDCPEDQDEPLNV